MHGLANPSPGGKGDQKQERCREVVVGKPTEQPLGWKHDGCVHGSLPFCERLLDLAFTSAIIFSKRSNSSSLGDRDWSA